MSEISGGIRQNPTSRKWEIKGSAVVRAWRLGADEFRRIISRGKKPKLLSLKEKGFGYFPFEAYRENHDATTLDQEMARYAGDQMRKDREENIAPQEYDAICMSLWFDLEEICSAPEFSAETISAFAKAVILKRCTGAGGVKAIIESVLPEVKELWTLIRKAIPEGLTNIHEKPEERLKAEAFKAYNYKQWSFSKDTLDFDYSFAGGQEKRDFISRLLHRILLKHDIRLPLTSIRDVIKNL